MRIKIDMKVKKIVKLTIGFPVLLALVPIYALLWVATMLVYPFLIHTVNGKRVAVVKVNKTSATAGIKDASIAQAGYRLLCLSGAFVHQLTPDSLTQAKKMTSPLIYPLAFFPVEFYKVDYFVKIHNELAKKLTKQELKALIGHELGHVFNGDLENMSEEDLVGNVLVNFENECKADDYGANYVGSKAVMASTLIKVRDNVKQQLTEEEYPGYLNESQMNKRIERQSV